MAKEAADGSFKLVYLGDGATGFQLELTWLRDRTEPYDLGEASSIWPSRARPGRRPQTARGLGCICFENPAMGIYFAKTRTAIGLRSSRRGSDPWPVPMRAGAFAYAELLRVVAMLAVIVLHVSGGWLESLPVGTTDWHALNMWDSLCPLVCAGLRHVQRHVSAGPPKGALHWPSLFLRYILRMVTALLFWGAAYRLLYELAAGTLSPRQSAPRPLCGDLATGT